MEMSCPWITNRRTKDEEKTRKYAPLRWELKQQYPGYEINSGGVFEGRKHWYKRLIRQRTIKGSPEEDAGGNLVQQSEHY